MGGLALNVGDGSLWILATLFPKCSKYIVYIKDEQRHHMLTLLRYRNDLAVFSRVTTVPSEENYNRSVRVLLHLSTHKVTVWKLKYIISPWFWIWTSKRMPANHRTIIICFVDHELVWDSYAALTCLTIIYHILYDNLILDEVSVIENIATLGSWVLNIIIKLIVQVTKTLWKTMLIFFCFSNYTFISFSF